MTTFTMQDLNALPNTPEEDEAMDALAKLGGGIGLKDMFTDMGKALANHEIAHQQAQQNLLNNAPPMETPTLTDIINNICAQLQLLTTVISSQTQPNVEEKSSSNASLQECVALTLQQADWLNARLADVMDEHYNIEDLVSEGVNDRLASEVEHYFNYSFNANDHFDIDEAVASAVDDKIDEAVEEKLAELVAEKMQTARVVFE